MTEREQLEKTQATLQKGIDLVERTLAHISHGGPTREEAEKWVAEAKDILTPQP
jgi:hypothetical protein